MLTDEDLSRIRAVVREELAARPRRRRAAFSPDAASPAIAAALDAWLEAERPEYCTVADAAAALDVAPTHPVLIQLARLLQARGWTHERRKLDGLRMWRYHRPAERPTLPTG